MWRFEVGVRRGSYWTVAWRRRPRGSKRLIDVEEEKEHKIGLQDGDLWTLATGPLELLCSL